MSEAARILVVDDDEQNRLMLSLSLKSLGTVRTAADGVEALAMVEAELPDLVLTDVLMPRLNGLEVCRHLKRDPRTRLIPVIILTSLDQMPNKLQALELDADDYLTKPFNLTELMARSRSLLRLKHYTDELENAANVLRAVAELVESRDRYTSKHCQEVAKICAWVAGAMGLDDEAIVRLRLGASFHDIGKIGVSDAVLHKAGPLDEEELRQMREHAAMGAALLEPMRTLQPIVPMVRHHHERLDGSGYPDGLKGDQIPLEVRILTVVDIYAALAAERPYKRSLPPTRAIAILREEAAHGWWDSEVVEVLAKLMLPPAP
jgi:putative two-component system response regulator